MNELLAALINNEHSQCIASPTTALLHARNAGEWLLEAFEQLSQEEWLPWLKINCGFSEWTAQTYMQIARSWPRLVKKTTVPALSEEKESLSIPLPAPYVTASPELVHSPTPIESQPTIAISDVIATAPATLTFYIPGVVVPKARPRVTSNGTFLPQRYREWRNRAEVEIYCQLSEQQFLQALPLPRAMVKVQVRGKHRGDLDNILGSCLDALVSAKVLLDDRLSVVSRLEIWHNPNGETGALIKVCAI